MAAFSRGKFFSNQSGAVNEGGAAAVGGKHFCFVHYSAPPFCASRSSFKAQDRPGRPAPGRPKAGPADRLRTIFLTPEAVAVRLHVLEADREKIQDCMNAINSEYTRIIFYRYRDKYSWVKMACSWSSKRRCAGIP